jgi:hypothetical protein
VGALYHIRIKILSFRVMDRKREKYLAHGHRISNYFLMLLPYVTANESAARTANKSTETRSHVT